MSRSLTSHLLNVTKRHYSSNIIYVLAAVSWRFDVFIVHLKRRCLPHESFELIAYCFACVRVFHAYNNQIFYCIQQVFINIYSICMRCSALNF